MKKMIFILSLLISSEVINGQDQVRDFESKIYFELNGIVNFYEVNNRNQIQKDTIYYSTSGFLINADWSEVSIDNKIYIKIKYPRYKNGKQYPLKETMKEFLQINPVIHPINNINGKTLCIPKEEFDQIPKTPLYSISFKKLNNYKITAGQLTLPFKLRPKEGDIKFQMTTDVTIGAYGGIRKRISRTHPTYITIPFVLGVSFINVNDNTTTISNPEEIKSGLTPGLTWSTGIIIQTNRLNLGFVLGRDYASGYAEDWIYHNKTWYSFGIGYSFLN